MLNELLNNMSVDRGLFDNMFGDLKQLPDMMRMKTDIVEEEKEYQLIVDLPGFTKENVSLHVDNGIVTIKAETNSESENSDKKYLKKERYSSSMIRQFRFENIKEEEIKASFENGILKVIIPKSEPVDTKKIIQIE